MPHFEFPVSSQESQEIKKEKPPFLYHASPNQDIKKFEPRAQSIRDPEEGPVVFATPDLALATTFLVNTSDSWTQIGRIGSTPYMVIRDKKHFLGRDKGGSIYKLKSDSFSCHPHKGMGEDEWVSKESVTPVGRTDFHSALDSMIENGVQVFFVDEGTFDKIKHSANWFDILTTLESENQRRGRNVVRFEDELEDG